MIQVGLDDLFGGDDAPQQQDPIAIMQELTASPCRSCRLGFDSPTNPGFIWKGNPDAHVAVIGEAPSHADMSCRRAFADGVGNELTNWLQIAQIPLTDIFFTYQVQCRTPIVASKITKKNGRQRAPHYDTEISPCFVPRCLRVLQAMPNLEVVLVLGLSVMGTVLGGNPQIKAYQGFWFGTDLLPGKVVYGLPDPRDFDKTTSETKRGRLKQHLLYLHNEYYGKKNRLGAELCPPKHVMNILAVREGERKDARPDHSIL